MAFDIWMVLLLSVIFGGVLIAFFRTKAAGFGKYTSATLLLILVLYVASLALFQGKSDGGTVINLLAAVAGFAGGLYTARDSEA